MTPSSCLEHLGKGLRKFKKCYKTLMKFEGANVYCTAVPYLQLVYCVRKNCAEPSLIIHCFTYNDVSLACWWEIPSALAYRATLLLCAAHYERRNFGLYSWLSSAGYITAVLGTAVLIECRIYYGFVRYSCAYRLQDILRLFLSSAGYVTAVLGTAVLIECRIC